MWRLVCGGLLGAAGVLALQALLVFGYLAASEQDPIVLNPERGSLDENGAAMVVFCGDRLDAFVAGGASAADAPPSTLSPRGGEPPYDHPDINPGLKAALDEVPPDGDLGPWTRGRTIRGDCEVWYHHRASYDPQGEDYRPTW